MSYCPALKLLSLPWWTKLSQNETNQNKQHYSIGNYHKKNTPLNFVVKRPETYTRVFRTLNDFPVYIYNGIPFAAHLASVKVTPHVYFKMCWIGV